MRTFARFGRSTAAAALGVTLAAAGTAWSQPPSYSYAYLNAACGVGSIQVVLNAHDRGEHPELTGFHIYRRTRGVCGAPVRLTASPLARAAGTDYVLTVVDGAAPEAAAHEYFLRTVDAGGTETDAYTLFSPLDSQLHDTVSCDASAPLAVGFIEDQGWALVVVSCPASCWGNDWTWLEEFPAELRALAGTGIPVVVYGSFVCGTVEGCLGHVTSFAPTSCAVGVQPSSWSTVKQWYR